MIRSSVRIRLSAHVDSRFGHQYDDRFRICPISQGGDDDLVSCCRERIRRLKESVRGAVPLPSIHASLAEIRW
jgi:hypothetical protein